MRRREFIELFGGALMTVPITWPLPAQAQQASPMRRIGVLTSYNEADPEGRAAVALFKKTLEAAGWNEGRNIQIVIRWLNEQGTIETKAKELVSLSPDVILASPTNTLKALQRETSSIPIVFTSVSDPLAQGIVASLARPGGAITGFSNPPFSLVGKSIQMLKEVAPSVTRVIFAVSSINGSAPAYFRIIDTIAASLGMVAVKAPFRDSAEIERMVDAFAREPNGGLFVPRDTNAEDRRDLFVELAARHRLPALYAHRTFVDAGGLMSYGSDPLEAFRGAASYVDRILRGENPGDLPVQEPTKFELVVNLKTARTLGLNVPLPLLAAADEVIE